jgi:hypothetical protein
MEEAGMGVKATFKCEFGCGVEATARTTIYPGYGCNVYYCSGALHSEERED